jgi:hypothetical protein
MADVVITTTILDPPSMTYATFLITYDDVTLNASRAQVINDTPKTARLTLYPPDNSGIQTYDFAGGSNNSRNLPPNGRFNLDTWGYGFWLLP